MNLEIVYLINEMQTYVYNDIDFMMVWLKLFRLIILYDGVYIIFMHNFLIL